MKKIETGFACGREYLSVNGYVVAVEGDMCRDSELPGTHWNAELLATVASGKPRKVKSGFGFSSLPAIDAEAQYVAQKMKDRTEYDRFVAEHLKGTFAAVEASSHETFELWRAWAIENDMRPPDKNDRRQFLFFEQISRGFSETIGAFRFGKETMPVVLSGFWYRLRAKRSDPGRLVLFWELCSQVTDSRMADRWLSENLPKGIQRTDAGNFHNVVLDLKP